METKYYIPELGIDGTAGQLVDWAYRYSDDYSDEALEKIADIAENEAREDRRIPLLVIQDRKRESGAPYERLMMDHILGNKISYSETMEYGELEIREERGQVLISVIGTDAEGPFTAAAAFEIAAFMDNTNPNWLESTIGSVLFYDKIHEEDEK